MARVKSTARVLAVSLTTVRHAMPTFLHQETARLALLDRSLVQCLTVVPVSMTARYASRGSMKDASDLNIGSRDCGLDLR